MIEFVGIDGDDTLWHNEALYQDVQSEMCDLLAELADEVTIRGTLDLVQKHNIQLYGYGVKSLILSMIETALKSTRYKVTANQIQEILSYGIDIINSPVKLLAGVRRALIDLRERDCKVSLITKGDLYDQQRKIERSGLDSYFDHVEIVSDKNISVYLEILNKRKVKPNRFLMVGNSLKSDILPVVELGGYAAHIPYHVTWCHEQVPVEQVPKNMYWQISHLNQLTNIIDLIANNPVIDKYRRHPELRINKKEINT